jgi:hypothetical protein
VTLSHEKEKEIIFKKAKTKHMGLTVFFSSPLVRTKN